MNYQKPPLPNQQSAVMSTTTNNTFSFKAKDIGFLDPNPNVTQMIEVKNNYNIYHNVFSFTQRLRAIAVDEMASVITKNLHFCLMSIADS